MEITLLDGEKRAHELFERWGRLADKTNTGKGENLEKIGKSVLAQFHWGQSEGVYFDFEIEDVSVGVLMPQLLHHTIGVTSGIRSYRKPREILKPVYPSSLPEKWKTIFAIEFYRGVEKYKEALADGVPAEQARYVLQLSLATGLIWSADLEAIQKLCMDRLCSKADTEIWELAYTISNIMIYYIPELERFLGPKCYVFGKCFENKPCGGHWLKEL